MKLYLSSLSIGNFPEKLKGLFSVDKPRIGIIMNALDCALKARGEWLDKNTKNLTELGFEVEELDLPNFFTIQLTEEYLSQFDGLWVNGGNVFILQRAFEQSGLRALLPKLVKDEKLVYAGFSAALYVVSPTIQGADLVDDPKKIPDGYAPEFSWDGLTFLDTSIAVHYKSDHEESDNIDKEISYYEEHSMPFDVLRDGEVYFENGDVKEFLRI